MNHKSLPELEDISNLYKYELMEEAERLNVNIPSNSNKSEVEEILKPYMDKRKYQKARSIKFFKQ